LSESPGGVRTTGIPTAPTTRRIGPEPPGTVESAEPARSTDRPTTPATEARDEATSDRSEQKPSGGEPWILIGLMVPEAAFVLAATIWAGIDANKAIWMATQATSLAVLAIFAKPAILLVGHRLQLTKIETAVCSASTPPALIITTLLELTVVFLAIAATGTDPEGALRIAAELTVLCMSVVYGRPALLAVGRRVLATAGRGD
jgi:hypothetical protein